MTVTRLASLIPLLVATLTVYSVWYDWVFFGFVGRHLFQIQTIGDHLDSLMTNLPALLFGLWLGVFVGFARHVTGRAASVPEADATFQRNWLGLVPRNIVTLLFTILMTVLVTTEALALVFGYLALIWTDIVSRIRLDSDLEFPAWFWSALDIAPGVFWLISVFAVLEAVDVRRSQRIGAELTIGSNEQVVQVRVVRSLERGLLVRRKDTGKMSLIDWSEISTISSLDGDVPNNEMAFCSWFGGNSLSICDYDQ